MAFIFLKGGFKIELIPLFDLKSPKIVK